MTPHEFIAKWQRANLSERSACQQHFLDLCDLLGQPKPAAADPDGAWYTFEKGVQKSEGGDGWADVWMRGHFGWEYKGKRKNLADAYKQLLLYREALENPPLLVVCDLDRFEIHTNFTGTAKRKYEFSLADLAVPKNLDVLRKLFTEPEALRPDVTAEKITADAAKRFADLAERLRMRPDVPAERAAHFLMKLMFCMFGEDIGLLPKKLFGDLLDKSKQNPASLTRRLESLFAAMNTGGDFGSDEILWFNGGLFSDADVIPLVAEEVAILAAVNGYDWGSVEPSIFGTLFESVLDPGKRSQIGAHYTGRADIETLVKPVVLAPLRREWDEVKRLSEEKLWPAVVKTSRAQTGKRMSVKPSAAREKFDRAIQDFVERLSHVTVLDPACGSGNFLYVSLHLLLDLEKEVISYAAGRGLSLVPHVHPRQLSGLEINAYAQQLASIVLWIGYLQWMHHNGFKMPSHPVLEPIETIRCQDAILDLTDAEHPKEPEWPEAEFIVGNPPFLGGNKIRAELGDEYVDRLFALFDGRVPGFGDLCCYWFEKARAQIERGHCRRAGLLATQGIRGGANREVLHRIKTTTNIFFAESDRDWVLDGANVHVSMVGFGIHGDDSCVLDGKNVQMINANLSTAADTTSARPLPANRDLCCYGSQQKAQMDIDPTLALEMLLSPNAAGVPNSDVVRPSLNATQILRRTHESFVIDFGMQEDLQKAAAYELPFEYLRQHVYPVRCAHRELRQQRYWWLHARPSPRYRKFMKELGRYLVTACVAKHRVFVWMDTAHLVDHAAAVFASADDVFFGILQSRVHEVWALCQGTQLETRPRYTPTTCFETFPFPLAGGRAGLPASRRMELPLRPGAPEDATSCEGATPCQDVLDVAEATSYEQLPSRRMELPLRPGEREDATSREGATPCQDALDVAEATSYERKDAAEAASYEQLPSRRMELPLRPGEREDATSREGATPCQDVLDAAEAASYEQLPSRRMELPLRPGEREDATSCEGATPCQDVLDAAEATSYERKDAAEATSYERKDAAEATSYERKDAAEVASYEAIAAAARELDALRTRWLNPPEWTTTEVLEFPGSAAGPWARYVVEPDARGIGTVRWPRLVPKDADCAASLKKRTLTSLYNQRPAWLDLAHQKLDAAVFAAYGWDPAISDETLLEKLLALNLERAKETPT